MNTHKNIVISKTFYQTSQNVLLTMNVYLKDKFVLPPRLQYTEFNPNIDSIICISNPHAFVKRQVV